VNVTVPADLDEAVRRRLGGEAAYSQLLQAAMRDLLACHHGEVRCLKCGEELTAAAVAERRMERFWRAVTGELEEYCDRGGTVAGFARVFKRIGAEHAIPGAARWSAPTGARSVQQRVAAGITWKESA
jgi:hypothetical protein